MSVAALEFGDQSRARDGTCKLADKPRAQASGSRVAGNVLLFERRLMPDGAWWLVARVKDLKSRGWVREQQLELVVKGS